MRFIKDGQVNDGHFHAWCLYEAISWRHFLYLLISIVVGKIKRFKSVTTHLPLELQHSIYPRRQSGRILMRFGNFLASLFLVKLYWENAPLLNYGTWDLKHGQTEWELVPRDIPLCFDTGHAMLGAKSKEEAQKIIRAIIRDRGDQIQYLHVHENDLTHDIHSRPIQIITDDLLKEITKGRIYVFEK